MEWLARCCRYVAGEVEENEKNDGMGWQVRLVS